MQDTPIKLVRDTISYEEIGDLSQWLETNPQLTKGELTLRFEEAWCKFLGCKHAIFVNSGSSANLAMAYALDLSKRLPNRKVIVPCVSWVTTVAPFMQLGYEPILCDADRNNLGLCPKHFEYLCQKHHPAAAILVHVLGFPNSMKEIREICEKYNVILMEDSCESVGSIYDGVQTGRFGLMSSFSTYYGHHFSTIEGGFVCTDDDELALILRSIRSHGWSRDLPTEEQERLRNAHGVDEFRNLYTFYYPGFNLRSTDLQAFLGLGQLRKLQYKIDVREQNFAFYQKNIKNQYWKPSFPPYYLGHGCRVSNFAYPIITPNKERLVRALRLANIECRPLVCGSISRQPFWVQKYGQFHMPFGDLIHDFGMYIPNHPDLTRSDLERIVKTVNENV